MGNCFTFRRRISNDDDDFYQQSSPACPALAKAGTSNIRASNLKEVSSGYSSPVYPAETGSNDTNLSIGVISGSGSPSCVTSAEVTAATNSIAGDEDHYQSSPIPSGCHSPACPALAKAGTSNIRASNLKEVSSGYSSPVYPAETGSNDTNLSIGVISGSGSPSCVTSAEVTAATNSIAGDEDHYQSSPIPSGCHSPACPALAKAGTNSTSSITEVHSQPAAHCSPACLHEDGTPNTNLGTECVPSGPCSPSHPASAEAGTPDTALSMASVFSGPSGCLTSETETTGYDSSAPSEDVRITLSSFILHYELGEGSFGKVVLATHRKSQQKVAIKSVIKSRDTYCLDIERYVMEKTKGGPYLIQLYAAFQTPLTACFVMEYASGGSLSDYIWKYAPVGTDAIKVLVAEISCGLDFLHYNGILHRDLKPDNILMDEEEHIRIADYGLAVGLQDDERITGMAGTIGFMAPEVVNNDFYQFEPDWFSLGVITYILATKHMPFGSMTTDEYRREVNFNYPDYPPDMDPDLEDFIKGLLCKDPEERLGISEDIRSHIFMECIDWEEVEEGNASPPFQVDMPMDLDIDERLSPSALMPYTSKKPEEEIYLPKFTYISSMWARM